MKKWTVLSIFLWIVLQSTSVFGQSWLLLEYQNRQYIQVDSFQLANANATKVTLDGCLDLVNVYKKNTAIADTTIEKLSAANSSKDTVITYLTRKDTVNQQNTKFLEKSLRKEKRKVVGGKVLITIFAVSTIVFGTMYITK